jgi:hypothetical protein
MEKFISDILTDLYKLDPSLREKEGELVSLIRLLISSRPSVDIDEEFKAELRRQLMERIGARPARAGLPAQAGMLWRMRQEFFSLRPAASLASVVAILVMVIGAGILAHDRVAPQQPGIASQQGGQPPAAGLAVRQVADNAFGPVASPAAVQALGKRDEAAGRGGAPEMGIMAARPLAVPAPTGKVASLAPYSFSGPLPDVSQKMAVLRHARQSLADMPLDAFWQGIRTDIMNIGSFGPAIPQMLTVSENKDKGYMISFDFKEGSASIERDLARWDVPYLKCETRECMDRYKLAPSDMPSDGEIIGIADKFLDDHGISRSSYAAPAIAGDWKDTYEEAPSSSDAYIPDVITVTYPLAIDGKQAYDESGTPFGMQVSVSVRERTVAMVGGIERPSYESSLYDIQSDPAAILEMASRGGMRNASPVTSPSQVRELESPRIAFVRTTKPAADGYDEYLVPAMVFGIRGAEGADGAVVVPLVKEFFASPAGQ